MVAARTPLVLTLCAKLSLRGVRKGRRIKFLSSIGDLQPSLLNVVE